MWIESSRGIKETFAGVGCGVSGVGFGNGKEETVWGIGFQVAGGDWKWGLKVKG